MTFCVRLATAGRYRVWLGGTFGRGFQVSVDGRSLGRVHDERMTFASYDEAGTVRLARAPTRSLCDLRAAGPAPGSGAERNTALQTIALEPLDATPARMLEVTPADATSLCGRSLDWIEVLRPVG